MSDNVIQQLEALESELEEKVESQSAAVLRGALPDYAEYRAACSRIRGLQEALEAIQERKGKHTYDE